MIVFFNDAYACMLPHHNQLSKGIVPERDSRSGEPGLVSRLGLPIENQDGRKDRQPGLRKDCCNLMDTDARGRKVPSTCWPLAICLD